MSGVGAGAGAVAALIAYEFREPEHTDWADFRSTIKVDELTLSNELWAIVGLSLLGALVCGGIAALYVSRKGLPRIVAAFLVAALIGGFMCWGARWAMDAVIYATLGGPETVVNALDATTASIVPWAIWQVGCGFSLSLPIAIAVGLNKFTLVRSVLGAGLVMSVGYILGNALGLLVIFVLLAVFFSGGDAMAGARIGDVMYLFSLGVAAGIAFGIAETVYKPAWLKSIKGTSEGRKWTLSGRAAQIGSMEGIDVYIPPDGTVAPVHAQIQSEDDAHFVVDLAGGMTVNGAPAQSAWLRDGDLVGIGSSLILYRNRIDAIGRERPSAPQMHVRQPALVDSLGNRHLLHQGANVVGRDAICDVALTWEPSVSRRHAEITVGPAGASLRDLGSTNGTFLDDQPVTTTAQLADGATVVFGRCKTQFEA